MLSLDMSSEYFQVNVDRFASVAFPDLGPAWILSSLVSLTVYTYIKQNHNLVQLIWLLLKYCIVVSYYKKAQ